MRSMASYSSSSFGASAPRLGTWISASSPKARRAPASPGLSCVSCSFKASISKLRSGARARADLFSLRRDMDDLRRRASAESGRRVRMWKNAPSPVGHRCWLTGLGPPVVFAHAWGPPHDLAIDAYSVQHLLQTTKVSDEHRLPVRASIESGQVDPRWIVWLDLTRHFNTARA